MGEGQPDDGVEVFLQWKGTDACLDFYCACGVHSHFDGYFARFVRCGACKSVWRLPHVLTPVSVTPEELAEPGENAVRDLEAA